MVAVIIAMPPVPIEWRPPVVAVIRVRPIVAVWIIIAVWVIPILSRESNAYPEGNASVGPLHGNEGQDPGHQANQEKILHCFTSQYLHRTRPAKFSDLLGSKRRGIRGDANALANVLI